MPGRDTQFGQSDWGFGETGIFSANWAAGDGPGHHIFIADKKRREGFKSADGVFLCSGMECDAIRE